jgi:hypothetical protein
VELTPDDVGDVSALPDSLDQHTPTLPNRRTEAKIGCNVPNRMTSPGMPVSVRIK